MAPTAAKVEALSLSPFCAPRASTPAAAASRVGTKQSEAKSGLALFDYQLLQ
jgi:hypothetical protein